MKKYLFLTTMLFCIVTINAAEITWQKVSPGVWRGVVGAPESYSLLSVSGAKPYMVGLDKMPAVEKPVFAEQIYAAVHNGKTILRVPLERSEQLYGFGLNFQTVHQRGKILELHVDHYKAPDNGRNHCPTPFYVSSDGYGIFVNSARYLKVWAGAGARKDSPNAPEPKDRTTDKTWKSTQYSDAVEMLVPAAGVEFYLFAGPTTLDAIRRYNLFCGGGPLPPRWGLGFTQRVKTAYNTEQVRQEVAEFEQHGFPLDFIGLEPGWQSWAYPCSYEWDKGRFPDPKALGKELLAKGVRMNLWINPYVSPKSGLYDSMYPLSGSHTVWCGIVPDFSMAQARKLWGDKLSKECLDNGVSGFKIDEVDGYDRYLWPDVAQFPSGLDSEQLRQTYGLHVQRITSEMYRSRNQRTYGLVRGSNGGGTSFPYVIYNDYYSHQDFITALINSGFSGTLWTPEVRGSKTGEEWLRRIQSNVFSPMAMINAWSSGTKPWSYPDVAQAVKDYALLRMRLMPYFYTEFARYRFEGTPPFRAVNLENHVDTKQAIENLGVKDKDLETNPYLEAISKEIKDQYMAGEYLLVAPLFTGQSERKVVLPQGDWYDFYTGEFAGNGTVITVAPGLEKIPVYVKDGAIIPLMPALLHAPKAGQKVDLTIRHYGKADGAYRLYDDDGETFDYEKGIYSWRDIKVVRAKDGKLKGTISAPQADKPNSVAGVTFEFMTK